MLDQPTIESELKGSKEKIIELTKELVAQNTTNPPGNEERAGQIVLREFEKLGITPEIHTKEKGRPNILGRVGDPQKGPKLFIACHLDVVPAGDDWKTDPFKPEVQGDKIIGRGVADNKGPLAAMLAAAEVLKKHESDLPGQIILAAVVDEEQGSGVGLEWMIEENLIDADFGIIPDIGMNMKKIDIAEKGITRITITSLGKQAHAAQPSLGKNAIAPLAKLISKVSDHQLKFDPHPYLKKPTVNIGVIQGGHAPNIVPAKAEATLDIRYLPSQTAKGVAAEYQSLADKIVKEDPTAKLKIEVTMDMKPHEIQDSHPLVKTLEKITKDELGEPAQPFGQGGGTFAKFLNLAGIPAVGFGPGNKDVFHVTDESISITELETFAKILTKICFTPELFKK